MDVEAISTSLDNVSAHVAGNHARLSCYDPCHQDSPPFRHVPRFIYRFEDLDEDEVRVKIFHKFALLAGVSVSFEHVKQAIADRRVLPHASTSRTSRDALFGGHKRYSTSDIIYVMGSCDDVCCAMVDGLISLVIRTIRVSRTLWTLAEDATRPSKYRSGTGSGNCVL